MLQGAFSVFLITLGVGQLFATALRLRAASLVGPNPLLGYGLGTLLLMSGALTLPQTWQVLWWALPMGLLTLILLLVAGSFIAPPPHPDEIFFSNHPAHGSCTAVNIPDGEHTIPGLLLTPPGLSPRSAGNPAVCLIPGAGDTKSSFKWRMVHSLLAEGLTVLTIDPPGHGDYRHRPLTYPDGLSTIPAAIRFLREQPGIGPIGVIGISMGGALAIRHLAEQQRIQAEKCRSVEALVIVATPVAVNINRALVYREIWNTFRAPILSLLGEISFRQIRASWRKGGYRSRQSTSELISLLNPLEGLRQLQDIPMLLIYGRRDGIAPPAMAQAIRQAAPQASFVEAKKASHVTLILIPEVNQRMARWLREQLEDSK